MNKGTLYVEIWTAAQEPVSPVLPVKPQVHSPSESISTALRYLPSRLLTDIPASLGIRETIRGEDFRNW